MQSHGGDGLPGAGIFSSQQSGALEVKDVGPASQP